MTRPTETTTQATATTATTAGRAGRLDGLGWNASVPPNGFQDRRAVEPDPYNDNPLGLATPVGDIEIETTPEHRNLIAGEMAAILDGADVAATLADASVEANEILADQLAELD